MAEMKTTERPDAREVIERYGRCLELVPMDESFHDMSVGLYVKDGICTVWTFNRQPGVDDRIEQIRDRMVSLGGLAPVEGTRNQVRSIFIISTCNPAGKRAPALTVGVFLRQKVAPHIDWIIDIMCAH